MYNSNPGRQRNIPCGKQGLCTVVFVMKRYVLALDQGTTSSRAILFDHRGNIVRISQQEFTQIYPKPGG